MRTIVEIFQLNFGANTFLWTPDLTNRSGSFLEGIIYYSQANKKQIFRVKQISQPRGHSLWDIFVLFKPFYRIKTEDVVCAKKSITVWLICFLNGLRTTLANLNNNSIADF